MPYAPDAEGIPRWYNLVPPHLNFKENFNNPNTDPQNPMRYRFKRVEKNGKVEIHKIPQKLEFTIHHLKSCYIHLFNLSILYGKQWVEDYEKWLWSKAEQLGYNMRDRDSRNLVFEIRKQAREMSYFSTVRKEDNYIIREMEKRGLNQMNPWVTKFYN